jgi:hypothetical protein
VNFHRQEIKFMNEIAPLAASLTGFLAPLIPYLVKGGEMAMAEVGKNLGADAWEKAQAIWNKLWRRMESHPAAAEAVADLTAAPGDADARVQLRLQLRKILETDPALAQELAALLTAAGQAAEHHAQLHGSGAIAQGSGAVAAGEGEVSVGRDVHGGISLGSKEKKPR